MKREREARQYLAGIIKRELTAYDYDDDLLTPVERVDLLQDSQTRAAIVSPISLRQGDKTLPPLPRTTL